MKKNRRDWPCRITGRVSGDGNGPGLTGEQR